MLMDPYVTARSVSTPCGLLALVGALEFLLPRFWIDEQRWYGLALCVAAVAVAAAMHPLMGGYAMGSVMLLGVLLSPRRVVRIWGTVGLGMSAVAIAAGLQLAAPAESTEYLRVALTRTYWFLSEWRWYELVGLAAPLAILSVVALGRRRDGDAARVGLARMAMMAGIVAVDCGVTVRKDWLGYSSGCQIATVANFSAGVCGDDSDAGSLAGGACAATKNRAMADSVFVAGGG